MPRGDGTGPQGQGPMTGGGRGYCALVLPQPGEAPRVRGYAGLQGTPVEERLPFCRRRAGGFAPRGRGRGGRGRSRGGLR